MPNFRHRRGLFSFTLPILIALGAPNTACPPKSSGPSTASPSGLTLSRLTPPSKKREANTMDSLKLDGTRSVREVSTAKVKGRATLRFADGKSWSARQASPATATTMGWVNPSRGFAELHVQSDGKPVTVSYPGGEDVYGKLELSKVHADCAGLPAARSYLIEVDSMDVVRARDGDIVVLYEYYPCDPDTTGKSRNFTSWVLWLSDAKF